jgi:hypothetical protein
MRLISRNDNDEALAANVRMRVMELNGAISAAENAGLKVELVTEVYEMRAANDHGRRDTTTLVASVLRRL